MIRGKKKNRILHQSGASNWIFFIRRQIDWKSRKDSEMIRPESRRRQVLREGEDRGSSAPHSRRKSHVQALDEHGYPRQVLLVWKVTV